MSLKKYVRKNIYKWHRVTSLLVVVPILLWTVSGFLHPVMGFFKPEVKNTLLSPPLLDSASIQTPLQIALGQNGIDSFQRFRIVKLNDVYYYQVQQKGIDSLTYLRCDNGNVLTGGDEIYAAHLAQSFLSESGNQRASTGHHHEALSASFTGPSLPSGRTTENSVRIVSARLLTSFTKDYKANNKILPVYEVSLDRKDGLKLYIETKADRLSLATDAKKRWFASFFSFAHSWSFLDGAGKTKSVVLGLFATLCFLSCICGFVVYNVINKKKRPLSANKRLHRRFGNLFLATTLLFAFSGAWHAFAKVGKSSAGVQTKQASFASDDVKLDVRSLLQKLPGEKVTNVSLVRIDDENYWQVSCKKENKTERKYIHVASGKMLAQGDEQYSRSLVSALSIASHNPVKEVKLLTAFNHQYSMMNKRLPVVENRLTNGDAFYIDPATGSVAAVSNSSDAAERFSFSNLHMYHFWEMWLGKTVGSFVKNLFLIGSTLGLLAVALSGVLIYTRRIARRS